MAKVQTLSGSKRARSDVSDDLEPFFEHLPFDMLENVFSFLPIKEATQNCTVSSRFRKSWHINRKLMFGKEFMRRYTGEYATKLVDHIFNTHRGEQIQSFQLHIDPVGVEGLLTKWLDILRHKHIEDLELHLQQTGYTLAADFMNQLTQLRTLKLVQCHFNLPPMHMLQSMAYLKSLVLWHVPLTDSMLETLVRRCRIIETVDLIRCFGISRVEICARDNRYFKVLRIAGCSDLELLLVHSPTLRSVHYCGKIPIIRFIGTVQLTEAFFNFEPAGNRRYLPASVVEKLVTDIPNVTVLTASALVPEALAAKFRGGVFEEASYGFLKLKEFQLVMDGGLFCNPYDIVMFMKRCPLLEKLFIDLNDYNFDCGPYWQLHQKPKLDKFDHDFDQLKFIKLNGFKFLPTELELVKIFLKKATNLEALILVTAKNGRTRFYRGDAPNYNHSFLSWKSSPEAKIVLFEHTNDNSRVRPSHSKYL